MKIPFDIKYRPQIESGKYKVETEEGSPARIICWDSPINKERPIIAIVFDDQIEQYKADGRYDNDYETSNYDLFIITPEPELGEFEDRLRIICENAVKEAYLSPCCTSEDFAKKHSAELLALAREQFIKDGYVIEKKAFHDAVENISDKHLAEMSVQYSIHCKVENGTRRAVINWNEFQKVAQRFIDCGKAEALKDLPRWRKWENGACGNGRWTPFAIVKRGLNGYELVNSLGIPGEQYIMLSDLEKLPGFNK